MKISFLCNTHTYGGGERSTAMLANMLADAGHDVTINPTQWPVHDAMQAKMDDRIQLGATLGQIEDFENDLFVFYTNNLVLILDAHRKQINALMRGAKRAVVVLNFDIGLANQPWFYEEADEIIFLNTSLHRMFEKCTEYKGTTNVLAPAVDLSPYLECKPDYDRLILVRHSKRWKFDDTHLELSFRVLSEFPTSWQYFMGYPESLKKGCGYCDRCRFLDFDEISVPDFLEMGSVFWYKCAKPVADQGPRVVVEAMAAGLACIVDDRDGMRDRVTDECGWRCNTIDDYLRVIQEIRDMPAILSIKGRAARARACTVFDPKKWLTALLGTDNVQRTTPGQSC